MKILWTCAIAAGVLLMVYGPTSTYLIISGNQGIIQPTTNVTGNLNPQVAMGFGLFTFGLMCVFRGIGILGKKPIVFRRKEIRLD